MKAPEDLGLDWARHGLAVANVVIQDWRGRPHGFHSPESCAFCLEFACRRCPVWRLTGQHCERDADHEHWGEAWVAEDTIAMDRLSNRIANRIQHEIADVLKGMIEEVDNGRNTGTARG